MKKSAAQKSLKNLKIGAFAALLALPLAACGPNASSPPTVADAATYSGPYGAADLQLGASGETGYISDSTLNRVIFYDVSSRAFGKNFNLWCNPRGIAVSNDESLLYVAHDKHSGNCGPFEVEPQSIQAQSCSSDSDCDGDNNFCSSDRTQCIQCQEDQSLVNDKCSQFTSAASEFSIVDLATGKTVFIQSFEGTMQKVSLDENNDKGYILNTNGYDKKLTIAGDTSQRHVAVYDLTTNELISEISKQDIRLNSGDTILVSDMVLSPDGGLLYIANKQTDTKTNTLVAIDATTYDKATFGASSASFNLCKNMELLEGRTDPLTGAYQVYYSCPEMLGAIEDPGDGSLPQEIFQFTPAYRVAKADNPNDFDVDEARHIGAIAFTDGIDCLGTGSDCAFISEYNPPSSKYRYSDIMALSVCSHLPLTLLDVTSPATALKIEGNSLYALNSQTNNVSHYDISNLTRKNIIYQDNPRQEKVAFASDRNGSFDIYIMNMDGTDQTRLTSDSDDEVQPSFDGYGRFIVFAAGSSNDDPESMDIVTMNVDGSNRQVIASASYGERQPTWTYNGGIAFIADSDGDGADEIWTMTSSGANATGIYEADAGTKIIDLAASPESAQFFIAVNDGSDIYNLRLVGSAGQESSIANLTTKDYGVISGVDWAPTGDRLIWSYKTSDTAGKVGIWSFEKNSSSEAFSTNVEFGSTSISYSQDFFIHSDGSSIILEVRQKGLFAGIDDDFRVPITCNDAQDIDPDLGGIFSVSMSTAIRAVDRFNLLNDMNF